MSAVAARFCQVPGGGRVAYATLGEGPPLVMVPGWLCHLEDSWTHPAAASARSKFAAAHRFLWYDRLGCGLSDREGFALSVDNDVDQLCAVMDAAGVERASIIGYSFGAPPAAVFAARYPERVERLVFYAAFARGAALTTPERMDSLRQFVRTNWGLGSRTFATMFLPNGSPHDLRWFSRFQQRAATAEMAERLLAHMWSIDVRDVLPAIQAPTLVLHGRRDAAIPLDAGREIAALVPGARMHILEGNEHDPFIRDSGAVVEGILDFVAGRPIAEAPAPAPSAQPLTPREREVLRLIAGGASNKEIAAGLGIKVATVERHVANLYAKIGARGRADAVLYAIARGLLVPPR